MRGNECEDYLFDTRAAAEEALRKADEEWGPKDRGNFNPKGEILAARVIDECLEFDETSSQFVVIDEIHGEYMVSIDGEWICTA